MYRAAIVFVLNMVVLAGCQAAPPEQEAMTQEMDHLPTPSIEGPTEAPDIEGPTGPPPTSSSGTEVRPQAVTVQETVEYRLPETSEAEFKN